MIFYDFEVFQYDWLAVFIDVTNKREHVIINRPDLLKSLYEANRKNIWVGFNNRHYDQYIMKGILLGMNPKTINDWIIVEEKEGWQYSNIVYCTMFLHNASPTGEVCTLHPTDSDY